MEVKNQAMDQLLVNTAAQAPANQGAKASKNADRPDFDSMVQKRTAEKDAPKAEKGKIEKQVKGVAAKEAAETDAPEEQVPVTGEQAAIAVALMMQVPPDGPRMAQIQPELIAAENTVEVQAVLFDEGENTTEMLPEVQIAQEAPAQIETAVAEAVPEQIEVPVEAVEQPQTGSETPTAEEKAPEAPLEAKAETKPEVKPETVERPEVKPTERQPEQVQHVAEEAPRTEEAPRLMRSEKPAEAVEQEKPVEDDANSETAAQAVTGTALFDRVDAPVVKVAEASKPIPLEAEDGIDQLGGEIRDVIVNDVDANRVEVQLTPENLGKLTVEITRREDGTLNVVLHTENQRTANLLEKGVDGLRQALAASRERDVQIEVHGNEETQQQFLNPNGQNEQNRQQQQQRQSEHRSEQKQNAQDFLQQLRLGLVDVDDKN